MSGKNIFRKEGSGRKKVGGCPEWHEDKVLTAGSKSPKGLHSPAQGRAKRRPGLGAFYIEKPCKGATSYYAKKCYALSGLQFDTRDLNPGRRFALPWARLSEPFRLQKEESKGLSSCHSGLSDNSVQWVPPMKSKKSKQFSRHL